MRSRPARTVLLASILATGCCLGGGASSAAPSAEAPPTDGPMAPWALEEGRRILTSVTDPEQRARLGSEVTGVLVGVNYHPQTRLATSDQGFSVQALALSDGRVRYVRMDDSPGARDLAHAPWPPAAPEGLRAWDAYLRWAIAEQHCAPMTLVTDPEVLTVSPNRMDVVGWGQQTPAQLDQHCNSATGWIRQQAQPTAQLWLIVFTRTGHVMGHCDLTATGLSCDESDRTVHLYEAH